MPINGLVLPWKSLPHVDKRTAPLNQRGEIADLRCIVVVVEDLQPLGPEVEQSLGHTFPATEIKPGMCHHRHAAVVPDRATASR